MFQVPNNLILQAAFTICLQFPIISNMWWKNVNQIKKARGRALLLHCWGHMLD